MLFIIDSGYFISKYFLVITIEDQEKYIYIYIYMNEYMKKKIKQERIKEKGKSLVTKLGYNLNIFLSNVNFENSTIGLHLFLISSMLAKFLEN